MKLDYKDVTDKIKTAGQDVWFAGLGVLSTVEKTARGTFNEFVDKGKNREEVTTVEKSIDMAVDQFKTVGKKMDKGVKDTTRIALNRFGIPTHDQIQDLIDRVEKLNKKVERMGTH